MRIFTDILRDIRKGRVVDAASQALSEVVRAAQFTGKPGKMTLELTVKPHGRGDNAVVLISKITTKSPQADLPEGLFFADKEGDLLRDDPTNVRMFADASGDTDTVDPETGEVISLAR